MFSHPIVSRELLLTLLVQHVTLVTVATGIGIAISMIVGIWATRPERAGSVAVPMLVRLLSLGQAIPSLAVLGLIMAFLGIGMRTAIAALALYAIVPMMRNVIAGLSGVDSKVLDAARGMGMSRRSILWRIELPLAMPTIIAGIRVAAVLTISTAALSSQIGGGGLGRLIFMGLAMMDAELMFLGAFPTALLAIATDFTLGRVEKMLTSWRKSNRYERSV
ncbi:ABC transporter permease [Synergistaceae bacterium OttesenSCG-928-I11]|nr:ABC transporter permease [Synergistaceae bacterium OttesenSCG-928-I11]